MIPAAEAVVMMRPPLPPLDLLIRSTARVIPIVAPIAITDRLRSMPACMKRVKVDLIRWRISLSSTYLTNLGTPALLHRISIFPPKTFSASSHIFIHSSFMVTSHFTKWTLENYMTVCIVITMSKLNLGRCRRLLRHHLRAWAWRWETCGWALRSVFWRQSSHQHPEYLQQISGMICFLKCYVAWPCCH